MKRYPPRRIARHPRVPAFSPVPLRARADGWTPLRQAAFLAELALTRCASEAARRVGMARETAHRLRRRPGSESFAESWAAVLGERPEERRKITTGELHRRTCHGLLKPVIHGGKHVATLELADDSALLRVLRIHHRARSRRAAQAERSQGLDSGVVSTGAGK